MKKLLLAFLPLFGLLVSLPPASALPGKSEAEIKTWISKHRYLDHRALKIKSPGTDQLMGFRQLKDHWFVDLILPVEFKSAAEKTRNIEMDILQLTKKVYTGKTDNYLDPRPWKTVACKDVWQKGNATAYGFLRDIYGATLAEDFRTSRLAYQGPTYAHPVYFAEPLTRLDRAYEGQPTPFEAVVVSDPRTDIFLGKKYAYQRVSDGDQSFSRVPCPSLVIHPLAWGVSAAEVHAYNHKLYQQWQKTSGK